MTTQSKLDAVREALAHAELSGAEYARWQCRAEILELELRIERLEAMREIEHEDTQPSTRRTGQHACSHGETCKGEQR